jgi:hypothetical protein
MAVFPVFNTPQQTDSPKAMELDEGDLTQFCHQLSLDSPRARPFVSGPSQFSESPNPNILQTPSREFAPLSLTTKEESVVKRAISRCLRIFVNLDDDAMRRIAVFPYMMSGYIQLLFNLAFPTLFLYWIYSFGLTIQSDVEKKVQLFSEEVMEQIARCSRDYRENRCDPSTRVPALVAACQAWEECMARDPHLVAKRSGLAAEIFGETLNSFFNVLSWKSITSLVLLIVGVSVIFNLTFSMSRKIPDHSIDRDNSRSVSKPRQLANGVSPRLRRSRKLF